jgi:hypothetical protein
MSKLAYLSGSAGHLLFVVGVVGHGIVVTVLVLVDLVQAIEHGFVGL